MALRAGQRKGGDRVDTVTCPGLSASSDHHPGRKQSKRHFPPSDAGRHAPPPTQAASPPFALSGKSLAWAGVEGGLGRLWMGTMRPWPAHVLGPSLPCPALLCGLSSQPRCPAGAHGFLPAASRPAPALAKPTGLVSRSDAAGVTKTGQCLLTARAHTCLRVECGGGCSLDSCQPPHGTPETRILGTRDTSQASCRRRAECAGPTHSPDTGHASAGRPPPAEACDREKDGVPPPSRPRPAERETAERWLQCGMMVTSVDNATRAEGTALSCGMKRAF